MEVILLEELKGVGAKGSTVNVKPGFARNYLLPRRLAISTGSKASNLYKELERQKDLQADKLVGPPAKRRPSWTGCRSNIQAQANEEDTLFGSITNADIADVLPKKGFDIDKRRVELEDHIKQLGNYDVNVAFYGGVKAAMKVWVVRA